MTISRFPPGPAEIPRPGPAEFPTVPDLPQRWPEQVPPLPPQEVPHREPEREPEPDDSGRRRQAGPPLGGA